MSVIREAVQDDADRYAAMFNRSGLGFLALRYFGTIIWSMADRTVLAQQPAEHFPRRYASLRRWIKDRRTIGVPVVARIHGQDATTGTARELVGEVVGTWLTDNEAISIGGRVAAYMDIEAYEIELHRNQPRADP